MEIGKFKSTKTVVVFAVAVVIAAIGIVSFAYTSAISKKTARR